MHACVQTSFNPFIKAFDYVAKAVFMKKKTHMSEFFIADFFEYTQAFLRKAKNSVCCYKLISAYFISISDSTHFDIL